MQEHRLALKPGYQLDHFRIEAVLGKGGFGITYLALDLRLGKKVAIKELLPDSIATRVDGYTVVPQSSALDENWQWARQRFLEEARVLAGFSHPAIVGVHMLLEAHGTVYMVMDYVEGESYEARLRRIGKEPDQASLMAVMGPILDGLEEVHAKGLLHRDIKPENILINSRGQPVLIDFGSARESVGKTMVMTSIVTHGYSPIEQYQTKGKMGPWTDIYAMGAVMCRAMTGEKPPVAADRLMDDDFVWLSYRESSGYSDTFRQAVDWSLRVRPEERPQSVRQWFPQFVDQHSLKNLQSAGSPPQFTFLDRVAIPPVTPPSRTSGASTKLTFPIIAILLVLLTGAFVVLAAVLFVGLKSRNAEVAQAPVSPPSRVSAAEKPVAASSDRREPPDRMAEQARERERSESLARAQRQETPPPRPPEDRVLLGDAPASGVLQIFDDNVDVEFTSGYSVYDDSGKFLKDVPGPAAAQLRGQTRGKGFIGGTAYLSDWSYERMRQGHQPNWIAGQPVLSPPSGHAGASHPPAIPQPDVSRRPSGTVLGDAPPSGELQIFSGNVHVTFPQGYTVYDNRGKFLKRVEGPVTGELRGQTRGKSFYRGTVYLSEWSHGRMLQGHAPNWMVGEPVIP